MPRRKKPSKVELDPELVAEIVKGLEEVRDRCDELLDRLHEQLPDRGGLIDV